MALREWKKFMIGLIDGVERHLCASAPKRTGAQLREFRARAGSARTNEARGLVERDLDRFVKSTPCMRAAAGRYVVEQINGVTKNLKNVVKDLKKLQKRDAIKDHER